MIRMERSIELQDVQSKLSRFLLNLERDHDLTIAEVTLLLSSALQNFIDPVVKEEHREQ